MAIIATRPRRFEYVHTPKYGSWQNLIECSLSKMARALLRHTRVSSLDEPKAHILKGIDEIIQIQFVFRVNKFKIEIV